jgi:hypothetical protein
LVSSQIQLNLPWDDRHFFYIFLSEIAPTTNPKNSEKKHSYCWTHVHQMIQQEHTTVAAPKSFLSQELNPAVST